LSQAPSAWKTALKYSAENANCGTRAKPALQTLGKKYIAALKKDEEPTAYVFRCLHCGKYLAYADET
jgi:uncharacterized protein CbrC (UPF0167 family)